MPRGEPAIPSSEIYERCAQLLLNSLGNSGNELFASFSYGRKGELFGARGRGANVFVNRSNLMRALDFVREHGAPFLRELSFDTLEALAVDALREAWPEVVSGSDFHPGTKPIGSSIRPDALRKVAEGLSESQLFRPENEVALFPLGGTFVRAPFRGRNFALLRDLDLHDDLEACTALPPSLRARHFPPWSEPEMPPQAFTGPVFHWLRVSSPHKTIARKRAAVVMGTLALIMARRARYAHSDQAMQLGECMIRSGVFSVAPYAPPVAPALMSDLLVEDADHPVWSALDKMLDQADSSTKPILRALEYFHRAWFHEPRERFPLLCMALDAMTNAESAHTDAAVEFVLTTLGSRIQKGRLRALLRLRGAVIHGAAPDVYESRHYVDYYTRYKADPILDLELLVAACLRERGFAELLVVRDPKRALIEQAQLAGLLPRRLWVKTIIQGE